MGEAHYKSKVAEAMAGKNIDKAVEICYQWEQSDKHAVDHPLYWMVRSSASERAGRKELAREHLNKAIELLGK